MIPSIQDTERMTLEVQLDNQFQMHGFMPFLLLMDRYEQQEKYEECATLLAVIQRHDRALSSAARQVLGGGLPTRYGDEALAVFRAQFKNTPENQALAERALAEVPRRASAIAQVMKSNIYAASTPPQ